MNEIQKENEDYKESNFKSKDEIAKLKKDNHKIKDLIKNDKMNQDLVIDLFT